MATINLPLPNNASVAHSAIRSEDTTETISHAAIDLSPAGGGEIVSDIVLDANSGSDDVQRALNQFGRVEMGSQCAVPSASTLKEIGSPTSCNVFLVLRWLECTAYTRAV
jgi:hypothetical protein